MKTDTEERKKIYANAFASRLSVSMVAISREAEETLSKADVAGVLIGCAAGIAIAAMGVNEAASFLRQLATAIETGERPRLLQ